MKAYVLPEILLQIGPRLGIIVNGRDVTRDVKAYADVALCTIGAAVGWTRRRFDFGYMREMGKGSIESGGERK